MNNGASRPHLHARWLRVAVVAACVSLLTAALSLSGVRSLRIRHAVAADAPEYNVKAGYLLLFTRYVNWPDAAFTAPDAPLVIAVLGRDPFGRVLDDTVRDQVSQSRRIHVVRAQTLEELPHSHVVFIGRNVTHAAEWVEALSGRPVLTVVESPEALEADGIVQFVVERSAVRFIVSRAAAKRAQLDIRTPMLLAAIAVRDTPRSN